MGKVYIGDFPKHSYCLWTNLYTTI